ncbi:helix-turn-helix transcriptional regulator [Winogradskya humida]|uniref:Helix-turn-helix transcriptional regulator n=1 Tax=Winogradskya humida TaxID=113566 RepID=A0ABQ3ZJ88_9ACTN|nr:LuxR family transcriptional regulator [Actinoplanes humidus]GIE18651.1 helix-turn-helix transcriptional regulator [Actinoplanes humidus]
MIGRVLRGRSDELRAAQQALDRATRGVGSMILVAGEPGIGKTALAETIAAEASARGFGYGLGKAEESDRIAALVPLLTALRSGPAPLLDDDVFHGLAEFETRQLWLVDRIADALEKRAAASPLLIGVDDLQWADAVTLFALRMLPGRLAGSPIVWVFTTRPDSDGHGEDIAAAAARDLPVLRVELGPLTAAAVTQLAVDHLGTGPDERLAALLRDAAGSPFLAIELLTGGASPSTSPGSSPSTSSGTSPGSSPGAELPGNLVRRVRHRLRTLPPETLRMLRAGAVLGRTFGVDDAAALLDAPAAETVLPWLAPALRDGIIADDGRRITFRHDLLRQAVYADIPASVRRAMHRAAADHLLAAGGRPLDAVPHVLADAEPGDVRAAMVLRDAAIGPPAVLPAEAAALIRQAFALLPVRDPGRPRLGIEAIEILAAAGHTEEALTLADTLLGGGLPADQAAEVEDRAADPLWSTGQLPRIRRRVEAALARDGVPSALRVRLSAQRALALSTEESGTAWAAGRAALAAAEETGDDRARITARRALGEIARNDGRNDDALEHFRELRTLTAARYFADEVLSLQLLDRYDESAGLLNEIRAELELPSSSARVYTYHFAQMWQDFCVGHLDDAETAAHTLLRLGDDLKQLTFHNEARVLLGRIAQLRGEYDTARDQLRRVIPPAGHTDRGTPFLQRHAQALLAASENDAPTALRTVHAMLEPGRFLRHRWRWQPTWFLEITPIAVAGGDTELAAELTTQAQELAGRNPRVRTNLGVAALVQGLTDGDLPRMQHGVALLRDSPRPSIRATAYLELGRALLAAGDSDHGVAVLDEAWETFTAMGAHGRAKATQRLQQDAGVRRRRWPTTPPRPAAGWHSLTPAEQRVALLIADGHTNRSAAAHLVVSSNTIATHIRSIFRKLDVTSRVQVANAVHAALDTRR